MRYTYAVTLAEDFVKIALLRFCIVDINVAIESVSLALVLRSYAHRLFNTA